ncbi:type II toxin-antitoxin system prevent-host-death family antitoxin [Streptomyces sp. NPDC015125]|uniref:type II toxin-antitoxin system prevent-host-death family antitoxin n=1 Tax=Streptomyces sp. NPDC015125 TaxID=3364938 RepID=UPI003700A859
MSERVALYRLYDAEDHLIYVGVTKDPKTRFRQHRADKPWWPEVAMTDVELHVDSASALTEERKLIRDKLPRYNERGKPWFPELGDRSAETVGVTSFINSAGGLLKHVVETAQPLVVTRHGKPVAVLSPYPCVDQIAKGTVTGRRSKKPREDA